MADNNLGNLYYSLSIKNDATAELQKIVNDINSQLAGKHSVSIGGVTLDATAAAQLKAQVENAASVAKAKVSIDANALQQSLSSKKFDVHVKPTIDNNDADALKNLIAQKLMNLKLSGVQMSVDRQQIQAELNKAPFTANLLLSFSRTQLQAAINNQLALSAAQARGVRLGQQQQVVDDKHAESLLRQKKLQEQLNHLQKNSFEYHKSISGQMKTTTQIATMLGNAMGNVFSVYAVKSFLTEIVRVGGELEKQRLAMRSILGNASEADEIYGKLKNLSMISPFDVEDLVTYTKQLSAFGIQYSDLYETAKRLSDIAAGVGVSFSRIAYEYGQTSARGWLDGRELRMFANSGIPLLEKLAKHYSDLRNEIVSTSEVRKMVSNREVSFKDVQQVLWQMTDEGGEFYNMQEVMAESLAAKWRNLGNAWNLMMGDMAEGIPGDALKWLAEELTSLTHHWSELAGVLAVIGVRFAASKAAMLGDYTTLGKHATMVIKDTLSEKQLEASELRRIAATRDLTNAEATRLENARRMTLEDYKKLVVTGQLTKEEAARAIAYGNTSKELVSLTVAERNAYINEVGFDAAQHRLMVTMGRSNTAVRVLASGFNKLEIAANSLKTAFLSNWVTILLMALAEVAMRIHSANEEYNDFVKSMQQKGSEGFANINDLMNNYKGFDAATASAKEMKTALEEMKEAVKEFDPNWQNTFGSVFAVDENGNYVKTLSERYEELHKRMKDVEDVYKWMADNPDVIPSIVKSTDGWFDESVVENANDWHKAMQGVYRVMDDMTKTDLESKYSELYKLLNNESRNFTDSQEEEWKRLQEQIGKATTTLGKFRAIMSSELLQSYRGTALARVDNSFIGDLNRILGGDLREAYGDAIQQKITFTADTTQMADQIDKVVTKYVDRTADEGKYEAYVHAVLNAIMDKTDLTEAERQIFEGSVDRQLNIHVRYVFEDNGNEKPLPLQQMGINAVDQSTDEGKKIADAIRKSTDVGEIYDEVKKIYDDAIKELKKLKPEDLDEAQWKAYKDKQTSLRDQAAAAMDAMGMQYEKTTKTGGSSKDPIKERLTERLRLIKEMYTEYKSWLDIYHNEQKALAKTKENPLFANAGIDDPSDIRGNYEEFIKEVQKYGSKYSKLEIQGRSGIFNFDKDEIKRQISDAVSIAEEQMSKEAENFNLYKKLFEASGDRDWSKMIAFGDHNVWDKLATHWEQQLHEAMIEKGFSAVQILGLSYNMSEADAEKFFGDDELFKAWLKIKERIEKNGVDIFGGQEAYFKMFRNTRDEIDAITRKYADMMDVEVGSGQLIKMPILNKDATDEGKREYEAQMAMYRSYLNEIHELSQDLKGEEIFGIGKDGGDKYMSTRDAYKKLKELLKQLSDIKTTTDENGNVTSWFIEDEDGNKINKTKEEIQDLYKNIAKLLGAVKGNNSIRTLFADIVAFRGYSKSGDKDNAQKSLEAIKDDLLDVEKEVFDIGAAWADAFGNDDLKEGFNNAKSFVEAYQKNGVAGVLLNGISAVITSIGQQSAKEDQVQSEVLAKRMDVLSRVIEALTDAIEDANTAEEASMDYSQAMDAYAKKQQEYQEQIAHILLNSDASKEAQNNWQKYFASYTETLQSHGVNKTISSMSDLVGLSPDELRLLQQYDENWIYIEDAINRWLSEREGGTISDTVLQDYIDLADDIESLTNTLQESIMGITFDDFYDNFVDMLMDMDSDSQDFWEDFEQYAIKASISDIVGQNLKSTLSGIYSRMMADMEAQGGQLTAAQVQKYKEETKAAYAKAESDRDAIYDVWDYNPSESSSLSSSISGMTEETADILAAYLNGIRADVAVDRSVIEQIGISIPQLSATASAQLAQLNMIAENTLAIKDSNASILEKIDRLDSDVHAVTNGTKVFYVK